VLDELKDGESESAEDDNTEDVGNRKPVALFSKHAKYDEKGNMVTRVSVFFPKWESGGTKKLFGLAAIVLQALEHGHTIIIDELDAKLHPNLTLKIVQLFHSDATNPHNAQLIFVTHDTGLLKRGSLCLDQICLVDKDIYGLSSLKTLIEYKINTTGGNPNAIGEEYEEGVFGAVPFLNSIDSVIFEMLAANGVQNTD
jgi:hypothetical protein